MSWARYFLSPCSQLPTPEGHFTPTPPISGIPISIQSSYLPIMITTIIIPFFFSFSLTLLPYFLLGICHGARALGDILG